MHGPANKLYDQHIFIKKTKRVCLKFILFSLGVVVGVVSVTVDLLILSERSKLRECVTS